MQIKDLGHLDGEITVFGGPYSNAQATKALLERARGTLICSGDLVAYCGAPNAVIDAVRDADVHVVAGNCEKQLAANALDCGCGFEDGSACDLLSAAWYAFANEQVGAKVRAWMATLPDVVLYTHAGLRTAVIHGGITDVARFIWSVSPDEMFEEELDALNMLAGDVDRVIAGHSGIAFQRWVAGVEWVNAGVIGMPPHDGTAQTEFIRIDPAGSVQLEKQDYDVAAAAADMAAAGLTQGYHRSLQSGVWPSVDVLPAELRR